MVVAEVVEALAEADMVLVDEDGEVVPLASEEAAEIIASADPWFDAGGGVIVGYTTLGGVCESNVTECHPVAAPMQSAIDDVRSTGKDIFVSGYYSEQITISKNINLISYGTGG